MTSIFHYPSNYYWMERHPISTWSFFLVGWILGECICDSYERSSVGIWECRSCASNRNCWGFISSPNFPQLVLQMLPWVYFLSSGWIAILLRRFYQELAVVFYYWFWGKYEMILKASEIGCCHVGIIRFGLLYRLGNSSLFSRVISWFLKKYYAITIGLLSGLCWVHPWISFGLGKVCHSFPDFHPWGAKSRFDRTCFPVNTLSKTGLDRNGEWPFVRDSVFRIFLVNRNLINCSLSKNHEKVVAWSFSIGQFFFEENFTGKVRKEESSVLRIIMNSPEGSQLKTYSSEIQILEGICVTSYKEQYCLDGCTWLRSCAKLELCQLHYIQKGKLVGNNTDTLDLKIL